jgi:hypothetical protein
MNIWYYYGANLYGYNDQINSMIVNALFFLGLVDITYMVNFDEKSLTIGSG